MRRFTSFSTRICFGNIMKDLNIWNFPPKNICWALGCKRGWRHGDRRHPLPRCWNERSHLILTRRGKNCAATVSCISSLPIRACQQVIFKHFSLIKKGTKLLKKNLCLKFKPCFILRFFFFINVNFKNTRRTFLDSWSYEIRDASNSDSADALSSETAIMFHNEAARKTCCSSTFTLTLNTAHKR